MLNIKNNINTLNYRLPKRLNNIKKIKAYA